MQITPEDEVFYMGVLMLFFLTFDGIFRLIGFIFDIDDFHFKAYGKMGGTIPRAFLRFKYEIQKVGC